MRHRPPPRCSWLAVVGTFVISVALFIFRLQDLLYSTAGNGSRGPGAGVAASDQAAPPWQRSVHSSRFPPAFPPDSQPDALPVVVWALHSANRSAEIAAWCKEAVGVGLRPVLLASHAVVEALPRTAKQALRMATWAPLPDRDMSPFHLAFHALAWASQAARTSPAGNATWVGFLDDSMVAHPGRLRNLMVALQEAAVPSMVGRQTDEGAIDARTPLFVPKRLLAQVQLPSSMPPSRGSNKPWLGALRYLVQLAESRAVPPPASPAGVPESLRRQLQRALQVPTPALEQALLAAGVWEGSNALLAAAVVPGLPPDVAGYLVAEWDLQAAMQRQRAHLQHRVRLEWLHGLPSTGPKERPRPKDMWFASVDGDNLLQCASTISTAGFPVGSVLARARETIKAVRPPVALSSVAIVWCRECVTATVIASLPPPASRVLEMQSPVVWDPSMLSVHSRDTSGVTLHAVVPFSCRYSMLRSLLQNLQEAFTAGGFTGYVHIGWSACDAHEPATDAAHQERIQEQFSGGHMQVVMVQVDQPMDRSANRNAAAASAPEDALLVVLDVDMHVQVGFLLRAVALVRRGATAYFPVVWSKYNPATVQAVEDWFGRPSIDLFHHTGSWREYGYGMVVMFKSDFDLVGGFDTSFQGWGGEDVAFYNSVRAHGLVVLRLCDKDLRHNWHAKNCTSLQGTQFVSCMSSWAGQDGSSLGLLLRHAPHLFVQPVANASGPVP